MRTYRMLAAALSLAGAAALGLASGGAASAASDSNPMAPVQQGNGFCGVSHPELPGIGFANYHRNGDVVTVNYHIKDGRPGTVYHPELWGGPCAFIASLPDVTTNGNGVANANGDITLTGAAAGYTSFFATSYDFHPAFEWNDTPAVTLTS